MGNEETVLLVLRVWELLLPNLPEFSNELVLLDSLTFSFFIFLYQDPLGTIPEPG